MRRTQPGDSYDDAIRCMRRGLEFASLNMQEWRRFRRVMLLIDTCDRSPRGDTRAKAGNLSYLMRSCIPHFNRPLSTMLRSSCWIASLVLPYASPQKALHPRGRTLANTGMAEAA